MGWCLREGKNFEEAYAIIGANSKIERIFTEDWLDAAEIRHEIRKKIGISDFGLIDSIIVAKQKRKECKIVSGDKHFKNIENTEYIGA